ncbi:hypothetical protein SS1G_02196 [Sclerotinia sclerotiorum 1980 UF-70]|uniref:Uncharacterized protein n=1 Tax=Sclerotinia sclerotiorum (strain ATCC 18683 / 1980 / Ss-1) TaxID=665079 RepID=A7EA64_SCLS1|nr:hypothetical protein SS1G_02196 [Sclerotinia sclerotiorum 1980 UF-70]EDN99342.1 hypothetical protein SS1G_02196 [Sclerotinia sclerotiorum 1980 UF-70]
MDSQATTKENPNQIKFQTVKNDGSQKNFILLTNFQEKSEKPSLV